jgi:hypothetical protein
MHEGAMDIIDHGDWIAYTPQNHWLLKHNVLFCKRVSDGVDWYVHQRQTDLLTSNTVKMTIRHIDNEWVVQATQRDGSMLWPLNCRLVEIPSIEGDHEVYRQKRFHFDRREFSDAPPMPVRPQLQALAKELEIDIEQLIRTLKAR